jgi:hypothetical protein
LREALAVLREFQNKGFGIQALKFLGDAARGLANYEEADAYYKESRTMARDMGWVTYERDIGWAQGFTDLYLGRVDEAFSRFVGVMRLNEQLGTNAPIIGLVTVAAVCAVRTRAKAAARLFGAFDARVESLLTNGFGMARLFDAIDLQERDRYLSLCRDQLDEVTFKACFAEGRAMTLEEALAHGLAEAEMVVTLPSAP